MMGYRYRLRPQWTTGRRKAFGRRWWAALLFGAALVGAVVVLAGGVPLLQAREAGAAEATGCKNVSGKIVRANQSGMTAVVSARAPLQVGSKVRVTASDGDQPDGGQSVVVTVTGKSDLLPGGVCLDLAPEAWKLFDPQDAAYRHATITVVGKADADTPRRGDNEPGRGNGLKPIEGAPGNGLKPTQAPVDDPADVADDDPDADAGDDPAADAGNEAPVCKNVSGKIVRANQSGMTAVVSPRAPLRVGSKVRVTASDGDQPDGGKSVVVTITGKSDLLPGGVCLDLAPEAWKLFDPQDAAYRHANITALSDR